MADRTSHDGASLHQGFRGFRGQGIALVAVLAAVIALALDAGPAAASGNHWTGW